MSEQKTVTIRGTIYDIRTGKPVGRAVPAAPVHRIQKFAGEPVVAAAKPATPDIPPAVHPAAARAHAAHAAAHQPRTLKPSHVIKQEAIADAMARTAKHSRRPLKVPRARSRLSRLSRAAAFSAAILVLGGYFMYLNMPAISTGIAAAQAGIHATYPSYSPSGYRLAGLAGYSSGMVTLQFNANAAPASYTVTQQRSSWDSSAVLANYVQPTAGTTYTTAQANGLTIYTYGRTSAWVNGGILYTISGNAPLSSEQVQRIAVSM